MRRASCARAPKGDSFPRLQRIGFERGQQLIQGPARGLGHDPGAQFLVGRVQGHGQIGHAAFAQFDQTLLDAAGGDRDPARRKIESLIVVQALQGAHDLVQVEQGFAHAHEDQIAQHGPVGTIVAQMLAGHQNLAQNLAHVHIPLKAHAPCGTEGAAHGAAHLRRQTLGPAAHALTGIRGNQDGFHQRAVFQAEQKFGGAVAAFLHLSHFGPGNARRFRQTRPAGLGDIAHGLEIAGHFLPDPLPDLHGPELGFAQFGLHPVREFGKGEIEEVDHGISCPVRFFVFPA